MLIAVNRRLCKCGVYHCFCLPARAVDGGLELLAGHKLGWLPVCVELLAVQDMVWMHARVCPISAQQSAKCLCGGLQPTGGLQKRGQAEALNHSQAVCSHVGTRAASFQVCMNPRVAAAHRHSCACLRAARLEGDLWWGTGGVAGEMPLLCAQKGVLVDAWQSICAALPQSVLRLPCTSYNVSS